MSPATTTSEDIAGQIRALEQEFARLANAKDAATIAEMFYEEDAQLLPPNAPMTRGRAAIRQFWAEFFQVAGTDVVLETGEIAASGDLACSVGRYQGTLAGERAQGKYMLVYRRQADGGYKAIADAFNADA